MSEIQDLLLEACAIGNLNLAKQLLDRGAGINYQNPVNGWTALHWSTSRKHSDITKFLLDHGADAKIIDSYGKSPLTIANESSNNEIRACFGLDKPAKENGPEEKFVPNYLKNPDLTKVWANASDLIEPSRPTTSSPPPSPVTLSELMISFQSKDSVIGIYPFSRTETISETLENLFSEMDQLDQLTDTQKLQMYRIHSDYLIPINKKQYHRKTVELFPSKFNHALLRVD